MKKNEIVGLALTGIEFAVALVIGGKIKKAVNEKVQKEYGCKDVNDYLKKVDNGKIRMTDSARRVP